MEPSTLAFRSQSSGPNFPGSTSDEDTQISRIPQDKCLWVLLTIGRTKSLGYTKSILKLYSHLCSLIISLWTTVTISSMSQHYKNDLSKTPLCYAILILPRLANT